MTDRVVTTVCHSHCGGACVLEPHVGNGLIARIETDAGKQPQYRACLRGRAYRQRVYAADRLRSPLRRSGPRGSGQFTRVSWEEALDTVASQLKRVKSTWGNAAILFLTSVGDVTWLHNATLMERLLNRFGGFSSTWGSASGEGGVFASMASYGTASGTNTRDDFVNSRLIIMWGWNPAVTVCFGNASLHLARAREAGARIVAVDPRHTDSVAAFADQWVPIRPCTDAAMLIAMAYVIISEGLQDSAYLDRCTVGFDRYRVYVLGKDDGVAKTPGWAEAITGVPSETMTALARQFATMKPAALMDSFAPGRTAYGEQYHRAAIALAAMTGNIGVRGGHAPGSGTLGDVLRPVQMGPYASQYMKGGAYPVDEQFPSRSNAFFYLKGPVNFYSGGPSAARVNRHVLGDAILRGRAGGYPTDYKMAYIVNFNYVNQYANTNKIARALSSLEFVAVQEQFLTPTARLADIVLPTNTFMERNDVTNGGAGPYLGYMNRAVDALAESKSHYEITAALAPRLGIHDFADRTEDEWLREVVGRCKVLPEYEAFRKAGTCKLERATPYTPFEDEIEDIEHHPLPTPSGKIEIYSSELAGLSNPQVPPIPTYIPAWEGRKDPLARNYPLQLVTTHARRRAHTQFENLPWLRELVPQVITMNAEDALSRGIVNGANVRVFNDRGQVIMPVRVTERIMPGVVDIPQGAWWAPDAAGIDRAGSANVLTRDGASPGGAFCSNTALVQVERA